MALKETHHGLQYDKPPHEQSLELRSIARCIPVIRLMIFNCHGSKQVIYIEHCSSPISSTEFHFTNTFIKFYNYFK